MSDVNVQETCLLYRQVVSLGTFEMTSQEWWGVVTCPVAFMLLWLIWLQISGWMKSQAGRNVCTLLFLTLQTEIQPVRIAVSVYHIDCSNIIIRYYDWNDAPTGLLLSGSFARRASSLLSWINLLGNLSDVYIRMIQLTSCIIQKISLL